jgi:predicted small lipoprotein YifL
MILRLSLIATLCAALAACGVDGEPEKPLPRPAAAGTS